MSNAASAINAMTGALPLSWFSGLSTVNQRLGELHMEKRTAPNGVSIWLRGHGQQLDFGAKLAGAPFRERQFTIDTGIDRKLKTAGGADIYIGAFAGCGRTDRDLDSAGDGLSESVHGGLYQTMRSKNGWYLDGVLKVNGFKNSFTATGPTGETMTAAYDTYALGGSLELGRRVEIDSGWYVEPQLQAAYAQLIGKRYTTSTGIEVDLHGGNTAHARAGFAFGRLFGYAGEKSLQLYAKVHVAKQWTTGNEIIATPAEGAPRRYAPVIEGNRLEGGLGLAWKPIARQFRVYIDFEAATADSYTKPWGLNLGVHYGW
jgi:outer membrane autotransporter protein